MSTELTAGLSVDEFLDRSFGHAELLGGETRPKPFGTGEHLKMQRRLLRLLERVFGEGRVEFELSVRIGDEVPIPDLVVLSGTSPCMYRDVLDEPPLLCIEVADLPGDMALPIQKAFGVRMDTLMRMQSAFDSARTRAREKQIRVRRFNQPLDIHP